MPETSRGLFPQKVNDSRTSPASRCYTAKGLQCLFYLIRPERCIKPETVPVFIPHGEQYTRGDTDSIFHRLFIKLERVEFFRQFHPEGEAAFGPAHPGSAREAADDCIPDLTHLPGIDIADLPQMVVIAAIGEELGDGKLCRRGRGYCGG